MNGRTLSHNPRQREREKKTTKNKTKTNKQTKNTHTPPHEYVLCLVSPAKHATARRLKKFHLFTPSK